MLLLHCLMHLVHFSHYNQFVQNLAFCVQNTLCVWENERANGSEKLDIKNFKVPRHRSKCSDVIRSKYQASAVTFYIRKKWPHACIAIRFVVQALLTESKHLNQEMLWLHLDYHSCTKCDSDVKWCERYEDNHETWDHTCFFFWFWH